ncbi:hypothetical protein [Phormidesmis priestleyi]|uniref:hypothetical protein n=1 Tax=Phormidesmis priestleyi TaxID=268141 RepID=UPI0011602A65|nr:hypothetical protein [Phormidesmis priestleyi]
MSQEIHFRVGCTEAIWHKILGIRDRGAIRSAHTRTRQDSKSLRCWVRLGQSILYLILLSYLAAEQSSDRGYEKIFL